RLRGHGVRSGVDWNRRVPLRGTDDGAVAFELEIARLQARRRHHAEEPRHLAFELLRALARDDLPLPLSLGLRGRCNLQVNRPRRRGATELLVALAEVE